MKKIKIHIKRLKWGSGQKGNDGVRNNPVLRRMNKNIGCLIFSILFVTVVIIFSFLLEYIDSIAGASIAFMVTVGLIATAVVLKYLFSAPGNRMSTSMTILVVLLCVVLLSVSIILLTSSVEVKYCIGILSILVLIVTIAYYAYRRRKN